MPTTFTHNNFSLRKRKLGISENGDLVPKWGLSFGCQEQPWRFILLGLSLPHPLHLLHRDTIPHASLAHLLRWRLDFFTGSLECVWHLFCLLELETEALLLVSSKRTNCDLDLLKQISFQTYCEGDPFSASFIAVWAQMLNFLLQYKNLDKLVRQNCVKRPEALSFDGWCLTGCPGLNCPVHNSVVLEVWLLDQKYQYQQPPGPC